MIPPELPGDVLQAAVEAMLPGVEVAALTRLSGGFRNWNFRVDAAGGSRLLRVYAAGDETAWKEQRLAELVSPKVRSPQYLNIQSVGDRVVAVREFHEGRPLHELIEREDWPAAKLGRRIGEALAAVHAVQFQECGELDRNLNITERYDISGSGVAEYVRMRLESGVGAGRIEPELVKQLAILLEDSASEVDEWCQRPVLVHGDFGATNLVRCAQGGVSILDWEFGFSASPMFDFGNLMRPPLETNEVFKRNLEESYRANGGELPENWLRLAQLADTITWAEFASRENAHPVMVADSRQRMQDLISHQ